MLAQTSSRWQMLIKEAEEEAAKEREIEEAAKVPTAVTPRCSEACARKVFTLHVQIRLRQLWRRSRNCRLQQPAQILSAQAAVRLPMLREPLSLEGVSMQGRVYQPGVFVCDERSGHKPIGAPLG